MVPGTKVKVAQRVGVEITKLPSYRVSANELTSRENQSPFGRSVHEFVYNVYVINGSLHKYKS